MKPLAERIKEQFASHANAWIAARQAHVSKVWEPRGIVELAVAAPAALKLVAALLPALAALPDLAQRQALLRAVLDRTMPALLVQSAQAYRDRLVDMVVEESGVLSEILTMHGLLGDMGRLALSQASALQVVGQALADQEFAAWLQKSHGVFRGRLLSGATLDPGGNPDAQTLGAHCREAAEAFCRQLAVIARTCLHQAMERARGQVMRAA
jgi:hypothetical protein